MAAPAEAAGTTDLRQIRTTLGLSRERLARLLDVSAKTVERWERGQGSPQKRYVLKLLGQLAEIAELGSIVYRPQGLRLFLTRPLPVFEQRTALQLIEAGEGERVLGALAQDYEGAWS
jgi:transcriptional regulator with XRE-family HTH domain